MKDSQKGAVPSSYWSVTCLCTTWKLLSGITVDKMSRLMAQYMSGAKREIGSNTRGALTPATDQQKCHSRL